MRENKSKQCKVVKNKNFTIMSNIHLRNKKLSLKAKGLMSLCLSLPENWDYSIAGLVTLSKDGRESVTNALNELKTQGFVYVEKQRTERGLFDVFYTFFENPNENPYKDEVPTVTGFPTRCDRDGFSDTDKPERENRCSLTGADNPMQMSHVGSTESVNPKEIITNNKELKVITNINNLNNDFKVEDLFELYKKICVHFSKPYLLTDDRRKKAGLRLKKFSERAFWIKVFENAEKSKFIRQNGFFSFDWIIKNDSNPLKVFEGNFNQQEIKEEPANDLGASGGKYSKCYG